MSATTPQQQKQSKFREACALYETLKSEWDREKGKRDISKCQQLVNSLKLLLADLSFMPTGGDTTDQETLLIRSVLEIATLLSVETQDLPGFERNIAELKTYYTDVGGKLTESPYCHHLLGLDLLCLLAQNRLADFHANLELLPREAMKTSPYIRHPIQLEQFLMEGSYNKIFLARENVPAENYKFFMDLLITTVRSEIARCVEQAYDRLTFQDAARLLHLSAGDVKEYVRKCQWPIDPASGDIIFRREAAKHHKLNMIHPETTPTKANNNTAATAAAAATTAPSSADSSSIAVEDVARNLLGYARSLETII